MRKVPLSDLREWSIKILMSRGVELEDASIITDNLLLADLRGVSSHGVSRLPIYMKRVEKGLLNNKCKPNIIQKSKMNILIDGDNGFGQIAVHHALEIAIERVQEYGICTVGIHHTNHIGIAAYPAIRAAEKGYIGIVMTNASPFMAPWGGTKPVLGTNPFAVAIPKGIKYPFPIVLDMATSQVARGKILLAAMKEQTIPDNWALDKDGKPTTNPLEALSGTLLPLGGPKGYGLSLIIDVLAGVMTGAQFGSDIPSMTDDFKRKLDIGAYMIFFDPTSFIMKSDFQNRIDQLVDQIKSSPPAPGKDKVFLPGEIEYELEQKHRLDGIPLSKEVANALEKLLSKKYD